MILHSCNFGTMMRSAIHNINISQIQDILSDSVFNEDDRSSLREDTHGSLPIKENSKTLKKKMEEIFRCLICLRKARDPHMCPKCSKLCCGVCFKKWLNDNKKTCPSCRHNLEPANLVQVRFFRDLNEVEDSSLIFKGC